MRGKRWIFYVDLLICPKGKGLWNTIEPLGMIFLISWKWCLVEPRLVSVNAPNIHQMDTQTYQNHGNLQIPSPMPTLWTNSLPICHGKNHNRHGPWIGPGYLRSYFLQGVPLHVSYDKNIRFWKSSHAHLPVFTATYHMGIAWFLSTQFHWKLYTLDIQIQKLLRRCLRYTHTRGVQNIFSQEVFGCLGIFFVHSRS